MGNNFFIDCLSIYANKSSIIMKNCAGQDMFV